MTHSSTHTPFSLSMMLGRLPPRALGIAVWTLIFGGTCLVVAYLYSQAARVQKDMLETFIREISEAAATVVDVESHERLQDAGQMNSPQYRAVLAPLVRFHRNLPLAQYLYTLRVTGNDEVSFVLDTAADEQIRSVQQALGRDIRVSPLLESYELPYGAEKNAELLRTLRAGRSYVDPTPFTDQYGQFVSGHAPLFDAAGQFVGFIGIDYNVNDYVHELTMIRTYGYVALVLSFFISGMLARVSMQLRQQVLTNLQEARNAQEQAENATRAKSEILSIASHDLKNPLNGITSMTSMLIHSRTSGKANAAQELMSLYNIRESSEHMAALVRRILDSEGLDNGDITLTKRTFDFGETTRLLLAVNAPLAAQKQLQLVPQVVGSLMVSGDADLLQEAFDNYISNAIKYSPGERRISIFLAPLPEKPWMEFAVEDEGPGLVADDLQKVVGKFQKLSARPTAGEHSTGLGLSIAKKIVELHGGCVGCNNLAGGGARFWARLPIAATATPENA